jgi:MOSC domain-containing protein YiiM
MRCYGHIHLGIYLSVIKGGVVRLGDTVTATSQTTSTT